MLLEDQISQHAPNCQIHLPKASGFESLDEALSETTHLLVVAHADDDGLIGAEALSETYGFDEKHMSVIVVSASPGTGRPPGYEHDKYTDEDMIAIRRQEQVNAADIGQYASTVQLGFASREIKGFETGNIQDALEVIKALHLIYESTPKLEKLYLHSVERNWGFNIYR